MACIIGPGEQFASLPVTNSDQKGHVEFPHLVLEHPQPQPDQGDVGLPLDPSRCQPRSLLLEDSHLMVAVDYSQTVPRRYHPIQRAIFQDLGENRPEEG